MHSQAIKGEDITIYGQGQQTRSFCFVDDLVEGIFRLLNSDESLPVNIGNPSEMTILEFAQAVIECTGSTSQIVFRDLPEDDPKVRQPNISKAKALLDWEPKVDLTTGLRRTMAYFAERLAAGSGEERGS